MLIHWVAPFLSAQLDHGFTIKRSGSLDYYQQPGMYWIRYEMVQLNSQCFHGNVLAVSILPVPSVDKHVFDLFPSPYAALLVSFESWLRCHAPSFLFFTHYSHWHLPAFFPSHMLSIDLPPPPTPRMVKRTVYSMLTPKHLPDVADCSSDVSRAPLSCDKWNNRSTLVCALYISIYCHFKIIQPNLNLRGRNNAFTP